MRITWAGRSWTCLLGVCWIFPALALASGPIEPLEPSGAAPRPECESESSWASRHFAQMPTLRQDCVHAFGAASQKLRVSHLRRGVGDAALFSDPLRPGAAPRAWADADEMRSRVEIDGSAGRWSYETRFDIGRETRLHGARLQPGGRSELHVRSGYDLGILRPGVDLRGSLSGDEPEVQPEIARGLRGVEGDQNSLAAGRATLDVAIPGAPVLTLGAGREQKDVFRGRTLERERVDSDFVSGALWYGGERFQAYAVSSVYRFRDELQPGARGSRLYDHYAALSYWPTATLTLNPSVQYTDASYDGRETWMRTLAASFGVYSTAFGENGMLTFWSGWTRSYDTGRHFDYQQLDAAIGAERALARLARLGGYTVSIGGSVGYSHYFDRLYPDASGAGYRALLTLRISAPMPLQPGRS